MDTAENKEGVNRIEKNMPSLEHLELSLRSKRDLGKLLGVHAQPSGRARQMADGYVRLLEKTLLEYTEARHKLVAFLAEGSADDQHRAQDHFESCVQSLHRAITYLDRLRSFGYKLPDGSPFVPRPRDLEVLREDVKAKVRNMRDAMEHLDSDILDGRLPETALVGVHLGWEMVTLSSHTLEYRDVTRWIEQLHEFAVLLSQVRIQVDPPPTLNANDDA